MRLTIDLKGLVILILSMFSDSTKLQKSSLKPKLWRLSHKRRFQKTLSLRMSLPQLFQKSTRASNYLWMKLTNFSILWPNSEFRPLEMKWKTTRKDLTTISKTENFKILKFAILTVIPASNLIFQLIKARETPEASLIWGPSWEKIGQLNKWKRTLLTIWMNS